MVTLWLGLGLGLGLRLGLGLGLGLGLEEAQRVPLLLLGLHDLVRARIRANPNPK